MKIKITKLNENAILPVRKNYNDAGADVAVMKDFDIWRHEIAKIPLGWSIEIPDGFTGLLMPRSSLASDGVIAQFTPIDSGYRGEVYAMLHNTTEEFRIFKAGDRICQLVIVPVVLADFVEDLENTRGIGGFGSTGLNDIPTSPGVVKEVSNKEFKQITKDLKKKGK